MRKFIIIIVGIIFLAGAFLAFQQTSNSFTTQLLSKLPASYLVSNADYLETFDSTPKKAIEIKPCEIKGLDPTSSPLCFTTLTIFEDGKTSTLDEYIQKNYVLGQYEGLLIAKLTRAPYSKNISLAYTPLPFMCIGTGGDGCMRKRFVYHLEDGRNMVAEISFMPYQGGGRLDKPIKEVEEVVSLYEKILKNQ